MMLDFDPTDIENAFVTALGSLLSGGTIRTLETYNGQLGATNFEKSVLFPAIFVVWSGADGEDENETEKLTTRVSLIICDRNIRGEPEARRGSGTNPGVYELLKESRKLLHGKKILAGWTLSMWVREKPFAYSPTKKVAIWQQDYELYNKLDF